VIAALTFAYAKHQRDIIRQRTADLFKPAPNSPSELLRIRQDLADMDLTKAQLAKQLDGRMQYIQSLAGRDFYISIDTRTHKMQFRIGKEIAREADVTIGESTTITAKGGRTWTFVPLKGGFNVVDKAVGYDWQVPEWLYVMNKEPVPADRPTIENGLGKYVIFLPNSYVIHSPPSANSPLHGPKPGSFEVPEEDLAAIWPRITRDTRVYIF